MEFNDVLNRRYSCRAFAAGGVEQEKVDRNLEAGRMAPTAALLCIRHPLFVEVFWRESYFIIHQQKSASLAKRRPAGVTCS